jgi:[protein-PII] uridylyltransferase
METSEEQASSLLVQFREWRSRVSNADFYVFRERVYFRAPQALAADPELAIRLFGFIARHGLRLATETERRIAGCLPQLREKVSEPRPLWHALNELLSAPFASAALRAMEDTGVLGAVFPEWRRIECLVVRDFHHRYTVDEHTLRAIQVLEDLRQPRLQVQGPFAGLLSEIDDYGLLVFCLLFHDTGKAETPGRHVVESARLAMRAAERIGMPPRARQFAAALIERHLELSAAVNSRDPDDPATARHLAARAETLELLKRLALLTFADVSAVRPGAMTPWKSQQLWRLYLVAHDELTRELDTERIVSPGADPPEKAEFLEGFPVRYLRAYTAAEIETHFELERRSRVRGVALDIRREEGVFRLTLVSGDRPFLLASIAGALASFGMNILKVEGYSNRRRTVVDSFVFADPHRTLELNPPELDRLRVMLERVTLGKLDVTELLRSRPKPAAPSRGGQVAASVTFDSEASDSATLVQIVAQDRPGLLYDLALAISAAGCNVEVVIADTEAHKALDVFYVTSEGGKLDAAREAALRESLLESCRFPA